MDNDERQTIDEKKERMKETKQKKKRNSVHTTWMDMIVRYIHKLDRGKKKGNTG